MSKIWELQVHVKWFDLIQAGKKKHEGRRYFAKATEIKVGDVIRFSIYKEPDSKRTCDKVVESIHRFKTFEDGLNRLPLHEILPGTETIAEGVAVYLQYVSLSTQLRDGVVFFTFAS